MNTRRLTLTLLVLALGAVTAGAVAGASYEQPTDPGGSSRAQRSIDAMAVFRTARREDDAPTGRERAILMAGRDVGAYWDRARRVSTPVKTSADGAASKQALLVPAREGLCVVMDAAATCPPDDGFASSGGVALLGGFRPGEPIHLDGLAVDGIGSVQLELNNGQRLTAEVVGNVFAFTSEAWPLRLTFTDPSGVPREIDAPLGPPRPRVQ
jgi:hypothetical protein